MGTRMDFGPGHTLLEQGRGFLLQKLARTASGPATKQHGQHSLDFCLFLLGVRCRERVWVGWGKGWEVFCLSIPCGFPDNREPGFCRVCLIFVFGFSSPIFFVHSHFPQRNGKGQEWFASRHTSVFMVRCSDVVWFCSSFCYYRHLPLSLHVAGSGPAILDLLFSPFFLLSLFLY
ncbi:hypothetical protein LZ31DRAFT_235389 [Colletotrichum somersetense]|nr:hypothetical protein LZ31DRAFT_235389 [Colletotrichum somersetense]